MKKKHSNKAFDNTLRGSSGMVDRRTSVTRRRVSFVPGPIHIICAALGPTAKIALEGAFH